MKFPFVSIIIPCYNERFHIASVIQSMLSQDYPHESVEVLAVDGGSTDGTGYIIQEITKINSRVRLLENPGKTAPKALNIGIRAARGEVIVRVDAHCKYPGYYISTLVNQLIELKADNVGAAIRTVPGSDSLESLAIASAMSHRFGVGNSEFRVGTGEIKEVDTVPFGCYHSSVFDKIGLFDEALTRNQDDEFNGRLIQNGGKIFLIGNLIIDYYARISLDGATKMFYQYGLFKPLVNKRLRHPATLRQFVPPLFVLVWAISLAWAFIIPENSFLPMILLAIIYFVPAFIFGLQLAIEHKRWQLFFFMPLVFFIIHFNYGLGYLSGFFQFGLLRREPGNMDSNR